MSEAWIAIAILRLIEQEKAVVEGAGHTRRIYTEKTLFFNASYYKLDYSSTRPIANQPILQIDQVQNS